RRFVDAFREQKPLSRNNSPFEGQRCSEKELPPENTTTKGRGDTWHRCQSQKTCFSLVSTHCLPLSHGRSDTTSSAYPRHRWSRKDVILLCSRRILLCFWLFQSRGG